MGEQASGIGANFIVLVHVSLTRQYFSTLDAHWVPPSDPPAHMYFKRKLEGLRTPRMQPRKNFLD